VATYQWQLENQDLIRKYRRDYYLRNKDACKRAIEDRKRSIKEWVTEIRSAMKCERCGEGHPGCLDFHHKESSKKAITLSRVHKNGWSLARLMIEIAKCVVLCANCHRKEHYQYKV